MVFDGHAMVTGSVTKDISDLVEMIDTARALDGL
jgi:hypothetical protein